MAKIITGYTGQPHVTSDDMAAFQQGVVGVDDYVLYTGKDFTAVATTGTTIKLSKSEIVIAGTHVRIEGNEYIQIDSGTQGLYRKDYIIAKYTKIESGVEKCEILFKKGTSYYGSAQAAIPPRLLQNDIRNGGTAREVALFEILLYGSVIQSITRVIPVVDPLFVLAQKVSNNAESIKENSNAVNTNKGIIAALSRKVTALTGDVNSLKSKNDFGETLRAVSQYSKATIKSWVSKFDTAGKPSKFGAGLHCQNASGASLSSLRLLSSGELMLYKGETGHQIYVVKKGKTSITPSKANTNKQKKISFGVEFVEAPTVICTPLSDAPQNCRVSVSDVTKKDCNLNLVKTNTNATSIDWVAFGLIGK